jgi:hypothetical protein
VSSTTTTTGGGSGSAPSGSGGTGGGGGGGSAGPIATNPGITWRLQRGARTIRHGVARIRAQTATIRLSPLARGRYVLRVAGQATPIRLVVSRAPVRHARDAR